MSVESRCNDVGALSATVTLAAGKGKILRACLVKPQVPDMSAASGIPGLTSTTVKVKEELIMVYETSSESIETQVVYAALKAQAKIGSVFDRSCQVQFQDESQTEIARRTSEGWRLAATKVLACQGSTQPLGFGGLGGMASESTLMTEMVFQRVANRAPCEVAHYQVAVEFSMKVGVGSFPKVEVKVPVFEGFLNELGKEGWELTSVACACPQSNMQSGVLNQTVTSTVPVHIYMHKSNNEPRQFRVQRYNYTMKTPKLGSMTCTMQGDHVAMIHDFAKKGWTVRGAIQVPDSGSLLNKNIKLPFLYFFQA